MYIVVLVSKGIKPAMSQWGLGLLAGVVKPNFEILRMEDRMKNIMGVDWGRFNNDATHIVIIDEVGHIKNIERLIGEWDSQIKQIALLIFDYNVRYVLTDQASIGNPLLEQLRRAVWKMDIAQQYDISINGFIHTKNRDDELIRIYDLFKLGNIRLDAGFILATELALYQLSKGEK